MCQICDDWESGQLSSKGAFALLGTALRSPKTEADYNHYMAACGKIVEKEAPELKEATEEVELSHETFGERDED